MVIFTNLAEGPEPQRLESFLGHADRSTGKVVAIVGRPGIGKTALA